MNQSGQDTKQKITICGIQKVDDEIIPTTLTVFGKHIEKDGIHYLFYDEYQDEIRYRCRITYDTETGTLEQRKGPGDRYGGDRYDVLRFQRGRICDCSYRTPMGLWEIKSETRKIRHEEDDEGFRIYLEYRLVLGDREMGEYELKIEI